MGLVTTIEEQFANLVHRTKTAVDEAVAEAKAAALAEEQKLAADVKSTIADLKAQVAADVATDAPEVAAAVQNAIDDIEASVLAVLASHGL